MADRTDELLSQARTGDAAAWTALYEMHASRLLVWLGTRPTGDVAVAAEDIAAETWLIAADKLPSFRGDSSDFGGWLFGIARRIALNHARRGDRRATDPREDLAAALDRVDGPEIDVPGLDWVRGILELLPPRERQVVGCIDVVGLDVAATARALGLTQVAVRVVRHRGLKRLRELMPAGDETEVRSLDVLGLALPS
ncbi:RNA polymerase sigma factor [Nocardioides mangrovi]|uniref:Sigma-70 family RNA polymerase sigma factor n=1 Tax=Nocardioides mangrovi TaxID=2874580 RepID=A0ABS7UGT1_9ACTN|nr:sigma-70 family RNA polymerase sigma factor [Nocardioides mangrovi]MBZ5740092.1 sigma-70 family RNA polymerase sigma factor [Nocardioides mangrovi]